MEKDKLYFNKLYLTKNGISASKENKYNSKVLKILIICIFLIFYIIFNNYKQEKIIKKYISLYEDLKKLRKKFNSFKKKKWKQ